MLISIGWDVRVNQKESWLLVVIIRIITNNITIYKVTLYCTFTYLYIIELF